MISLDDARRQCRIVDDSEDESLQTYIDSARGFLESNYAVALSESAFESDFRVSTKYQNRFYIPMRPLLSVESAVLDGVEIAPPAIRIGTYVAFLEFPQDLPQGSYLTVKYTAGYRDGQIPEEIKQAARLLVAHYYDNRNPETSQSVNRIEYAVEALMAKYKRIIVA